MLKYIISFIILINTANLWGHAEQEEQLRTFKSKSSRYLYEMEEIFEHNSGPHQYDKNVEKELEFFKDYILELNVQLAERYREKAIPEKYILGSLRFVYSEIKHYINIPELLTVSGKRLRKFGYEYGTGIIALYVALEVTERIVAPYLGYILFGGSGGLAATPFIHHEYFTIPMFLGFVKWKKLRRKMAMAVPDYKRSRRKEVYTRMMNAYSRLTKTNPDQELVRLIHQNQIYIIFSSSKYIWLPLWIRQNQDRNSISSNEISLSFLEAALTNKKHLELIKRQSNKNNSLYAFLLYHTVMKNKEWSDNYKNLIDKNWEKESTISIEKIVAQAKRHFEELPMAYQELLNSNIKDLEVPWADIKKLLGQNQLKALDRFNANKRVFQSLVLQKIFAHDNTNSEFENFLKEAQFRADYFTKSNLNSFVYRSKQFHLDINHLHSDFFHDLNFLLSGLKQRKWKRTNRKIITNLEGFILNYLNQQFKAELEKIEFNYLRSNVDDTYGEIDAIHEELKKLENKFADFKFKTEAILRWLEKNKENSKIDSMRLVLELENLLNLDMQKVLAPNLYLKFKLKKRNKILDKNSCQTMFKHK